MTAAHPHRSAIQAASAARQHHARPAACARIPGQGRGGYFSLLHKRFGVSYCEIRRAQIHGTLLLAIVTSADLGCIGSQWASHLAIRDTAGFVQQADLCRTDDCSRSNLRDREHCELPGSFGSSTARSCPAGGPGEQVAAGMSCPPAGVSTGSLDIPAAGLLSAQRPGTIFVGWEAAPAAEGTS